MVKLSMYNWIKIMFKFFIDNKPTFEKIEDFLKSNLKLIISVPRVLPKKQSLVRFFERVYKIRVVIFFLIQVKQVLQYPSLNLI